MEKLTAAELAQVLRYGEVFGAITLLGEEFMHRRNKSRKQTPYTASFRAKTEGNEIAALISDCFTAYMLEKGDNDAHPLRTHATDWATHLINRTHIKITRNLPNTDTNQAACFDKGANTLIPFPFEDEAYGGAPTDNLFIEIEPINIYFEYIPGRFGEVRICRIRTAVEDADFSFNEVLDMNHLQTLAQKYKEERPSWLELLFVECQVEATQAETSETENSFDLDSIEEISAPAAPPSEVEEIEEDTDQRKAS